MRRPGTTLNIAAGLSLLLPTIPMTQCDKLQNKYRDKSQDEQYDFHTARSSQHAVFRCKTAVGRPHAQLANPSNPSPKGCSSIRPEQWG